MTQVEAHAKINLRHRVFGRDETGYHAVETILVRTTLTDSVILEEAGEGISVVVDGSLSAGVPVGRGNLCWRAADLFLRRAFPRVSARPSVHIAITKRIPMGSGLGGGSADAGATLRLLAARWDKLSEGDLVSIAGELGSDVPFALIGVPMALGWERGRRLLPLRPPRSRPALLVCPPVHVATPDAYRWFRESRPDHGGAAVLPGVVRLASWESLDRLVRNDLEGPVTAHHPELASELDRLWACEPATAGMTGSGSALFAIFRDDSERASARATLETPAGARESPWPLLEIEVPA